VAIDSLQRDLQSAFNFLNIAQLWNPGMASKFWSGQQFSNYRKNKDTNDEVVQNHAGVTFSFLRAVSSL
jgi:hypothetical protein